MRITEIDWSKKAKRLLRSELVRRGISSENLVGLLQNIGVKKRRQVLTVKISPSTFRGVFLIQCLNAMGIRNFVPEIENDLVLHEPIVVYKTRNNKTKIK